MTASPSLSFLRECLNYDPESGILSWKDNRPEHHFKTRRARSIWHARYAGNAIKCVAPSGYIVFRLLGRTWLAHRVCFAIDNNIEIDDLPEQIDHRDTTRTNNCRANLRAADNLSNSWNMSRPSHNTSGYKGVTWGKQQGKWRSIIHIDGKQKHLGFFDDPSDAHAAYIRAANDNFGEFARAS